MVFKIQENGLVYQGVELKPEIVQLFFDKSLGINLDSGLVTHHWGRI